MKKEVIKNNFVSIFTIFIELCTIDRENTQKQIKNKIKLDTTVLCPSCALLVMHNMFKKGCRVGLN